MRLNKKYQIEKAASTDETRFAITYVHIGEDRKSLVATTGRILAVVPVELDKSDDIGSASIPPDVLTKARKISRKQDSGFTLTLNGSFEFEDKSTAPRPSADYVGHYPQWQQLTPKEPIIKNTVTINPRLLLDLARALGDEKSVTLQFQDESGYMPIIVRNGEAYGLIMPMKK